MRILIIVPAYNEEGNIEGVIKSIRGTSSDYDIIVINDCSTDETERITKSQGIKVVSLPINMGIGGTVQTGFKYAYQNKYDIAVQVDGDGQHNPQYINDLITPIQQNRADVVIGSRYIKKKGFQSSSLRRMGIRLFELMNKIVLRQNITDSTSGFRAYNASSIDLLKDNYPIDFPEPEAVILLKKKKFRIMEVPVEMNTREKGISSITGIKSIYYMIKVTISIIIESLRRYNG